MKKNEFFNPGKLKKLLVMACVLFAAFGCEKDETKMPKPDDHLKCLALVKIKLL